MKDNSFIIDARISVYDYEEEFEIEFPEDREYDTLGGFIFQAIGDIPKVDQKVEYKHHIYTVKKLDGNRIGKVFLEIGELDIEENFEESKTAKEFDTLIELLKTLRAPGGCDWDREQTSESLVPYLLEETYEVIEAIEENNAELLKEELEI